MRRHKKSFLILAALLTAPILMAQSPVGPGDGRESNIKAYVDLLRKDLKKDKVAVLTEIMDLTPEEAAKFWPIYSDYDNELTKLGDERIAFFRMYVDNYAALTNEQATTIVNGLLDVQARRTALQKKFFQRVSEALNPKLAARFVQVEHQLLLVLDLQVAASLPVVE